MAVEDANHPNPYMFAGVRYDIEIGLYYNLARYYNPFTGRFLQTDPIGYKDGMNWYAYCRNNPVVLSDPTGTWSAYDADWVIIGDENDANNRTDALRITYWNDDEKTLLGGVAYFLSWEDMWDYVHAGGNFHDPEFDVNSFTAWALEAHKRDAEPPKPGWEANVGTKSWIGGSAIVIGTGVALW